MIDSFQALTTKHGADFGIKHCSVEPLIFREELIVCCSTVLVAEYLHCDYARLCIQKDDVPNGDFYVTNLHVLFAYMQIS